MYRTVDHIFILKTIINKYVYKCKKKVYACFIDFKKVWRSALFIKLKSIGIPGKVYNIIHNLYSNTLNCLYACKNYSYFSKLYIFKDLTLLMMCWLYRATQHLVDLGNNNVLIKFRIFYIRVEVQDIPLDVPFADWIQLGLVDFSLNMV